MPRLLSRWSADAGIAPNIAEWRQIPARPAQLEALPDDLHPLLQQALAQRGIAALYTHQAQAWRKVRQGQHVAVIAGTASGKTLSYNLPILDTVLRDPQARAIYLFPTKALAQDQLASLNALLASLPPGDGELPAAAIYDGDTPTRNRPAIRRAVRLLLTNPDMLHVGILPHHTAWADFFRGLRFVVIDEAHVYRGVFGSHIANVVRRLKRVAAFYGARPQFLLTTATLANPQEFTRLLVEETPVIIDQDGSGRGPKHFLIYNPPIVDTNLGLRRSALHETVRLAEDALAYSVQTIVFGRSRRSVELALSYLRGSPGGDLTSEATGDETLIRGYRSGYLPEQRREIERGLRSGAVRLVVATNALELGIDIGGMGAALMIGYPGSMAAAWQQAGRAGRGMEASLAVLVATADPLDQFLAAHPDYFFGRPIEHALINPDNLLILLEHIRCAAFELPFQTGDSFGSVPPELLQEFLEVLREQGQLHHSGARYFWMADAYPSQNVSLRSASAETVLLQASEADRLATIGRIDWASALWMAHPEAIYLHEAQAYRVIQLDLEQKVAHLQRTESDYYTLPRTETTVELVEKTAQTSAPGAQKALGELQVTRRVVGFQKVRWFSHEVLATEPLELPATKLLTTGYWIAPDETVIDRLREDRLWRSDPNNYGPGWSALRERVRRRDLYRCQVCGAPETDRTHDVHHKTPFRLFASAEQANRLENLVTLCSACHRRAEAAVRVRSGLAGLAYVLGHLAPFLLMCDINDLGVHADPQSPLADGRPAIVVYDQAPGGVGLSSRLYDLHENLLRQAAELVGACACADGCPSCVGPGGVGLASSQSSPESGYGGKKETLALLEALTTSVPKL